MSISGNTAIQILGESNLTLSLRNALEDYDDGECI